MDVIKDLAYFYLYGTKTVKPDSQINRKYFTENYIYMLRRRNVVNQPRVLKKLKVLHILE